jgi:predicted Zn-dependent peptidase
MGIIELRKELHNYINLADEKFLKMVYAMSREYQKPVIGYDTDGKKITRQDLKKRAKAASERVKSGDFLTQEEVEKEIENW